MTHWRSIHVHYGDLDRLVLECVHPVLERVQAGLERRWWERHYAGGSHLRICLRGDEPTLSAAADDVRAAAEAFMAAHPSPDSTTYSEARAAELMRREDEPFTDNDLHYRNNQVVERPYHSRREAHVSDDAAELAQDFRHDAVSLATRILAGPRDVREALLRLYFAHALSVCGGRLAEGSVSFKSHWSGFASNFPAPQVVQRIEAAYEAGREAIAALLADVLLRWDQEELAGDAVLGEWRELMKRYGARAAQLLAAGTHITAQPRSLAEARASREVVLNGLKRDNEFVRALWADERFMAAVQHEPGFLVPRVQVNLLYLLVAAAGMNAIDRMSLCHFAYRAAEDHSGRDLTDIVRQNVARAVRSHEHQLA